MGSGIVNRQRVAGTFGTRSAPSVAMKPTTRQLHPSGQPDLTSTVSITKRGETWAVEWRDLPGIDRELRADAEFHRRAQASEAPDVFKVWRRHENELGKSAEISGNRSGGSARSLTLACALDIYGAALATFEDALSEPLPTGFPPPDERNLIREA